MKITTSYYYTPLRLGKSKRHAMCWEGYGINSAGGYINWYNHFG